MAYRQYTKCVAPGSFVDLSMTWTIGWRNVIILVLTGGFAAWLAIVFLGGPPALISAIALFASAVVYLYWWLYGRLICLGGERCVIGMVRSLSAADPLQKAGDDDFSMNLMLAPAPTGFPSDFPVGSEPPVSDYQTALQGDLVSPHPAVLAVGRGYDTRDKYVTALHCEFEGSGIRNLLIWAGVVLALLIAALALEVLLPPGLNWIVKLLIMLAIVIAGTAILTGPAAGKLAAGAGHPTDVGEHLKNLARGDIVVVKGEWIYDSLHEGWNEIHPIRACCIIGKGALKQPWPVNSPDAPNLGTAQEVDALRRRWCAMLDDADDCEEGGNRSDPAHDWVLHPLVDGCRESVVIL